MQQQPETRNLKPETNCILVPSDKGLQVIDVHSIIRVQSISNYSKLFFKNGKTQMHVFWLVFSTVSLAYASHQFGHRQAVITCGYGEDTSKRSLFLVSICSFL